MRCCGPVRCSLCAQLPASTPFAKLLLGAIDSWLLAALLYLGSGVGLGIVFLIRKLRGFDAASDQRLDRAGWLSLAGAIFSGGVVGPVLLMIGLNRTSASTASLLLNLEGGMTALLAWFLFKETLTGASLWEWWLSSAVLQLCHGRVRYRSSRSLGH